MKNSVQKGDQCTTPLARYLTAGQVTASAQGSLKSECNALATTQQGSSSRGAGNAHRHSPGVVCPVQSSGSGRLPGSPLAGPRGDALAACQGALDGLPSR